MLKLIYITLTLIFLSTKLDAQDTTIIYPLSSDLLLIHVDEGYVIHPQNGDVNDSGMIFRNPLNVDEASDKSNFSIKSATDINYTVAKSPLTVSRKTKPTEFLKKCESWEYLPYYDRVGCLNSEDHVSEHWLYLSLPSALSKNIDYTVTIDNEMYDGPLTFDFVFAPENQVSELIHTNNIGYATAATEKFGYLYGWIGDGGALNLDSHIDEDFYLINNSDGSRVFNGKVKFRESPSNEETYVANADATFNKNFNGTFVYECDFSAYNEPGSYHLFIEGIGRSFDFDISCNAMRKPFEMVMKGIYNNRSGVELIPPYSEALRPNPHHPSETPGFGNRLKFTSTTICEVSSADASFDDKELWENGYQGLLTETWGWYQDAGDWDAYSSHHKVSSLLMFAYEHFPLNFTDGQLIIPENDNDIPDILDEARWLPRFYKRIKDETESKNWTTGGVPGARIFGDLWGDDLGENDIVRGSWEDIDRDWYVSGEDVNMTFLYAAMSAHFSYLLERDNLTDPENIDWEQEAIDAYSWAITRHSSGDFCQNRQIDWSLNFAAAALYRLTEGSEYESDFVTSWNAIPGKSDLQGEEAFGAYVYNFTELDRNSTVLAESNSLIKSTASYNLLEIGNDRACRWGGNPFFPMLSGQPTTPYVVEGVIAAVLLSKENNPLADEYWKIIHNTADYFLGTNPLRMTWITGLGEISPEGILHLDSWATGDGEVKEGIVPYGPWRKQNSQNLGAFSNEWPHQWTYPDIDLWPGHERWFSQRYSPLGSEFTIHQNNATAALVYGSLSGNYLCSEVVDTKDLELNSSEKVTIYPNPTPGVFRIMGIMESYKLTVVNQLGQTVLKLPEVGSNYEIDLSNFRNGVYYLKLEAKNGKLVMKSLIKQ